MGLPQRQKVCTYGGRGGDAGDAGPCSCESRLTVVLMVDHATVALPYLNSLAPAEAIRSRSILYQGRVEEGGGGDNPLWWSRRLPSNGEVECTGVFIFVGFLGGLCMTRLSMYFGACCSQNAADAEAHCPGVQARMRRMVAAQTVQGVCVGGRASVSAPGRPCSSTSGAGVLFRVVACSAVATENCSSKLLACACTCFVWCMMQAGHIRHRSRRCALVEVDRPSSWRR